ncbi:Protein CBG12211 [Caenorhabditis briggsae]|uniref:Protein CBG12211 n=1 Tax=Caenorhabditis briggsae TaxID=6238 RepID=A8XEZ5_CAEBR|nr:Protein CBG12211 [Caenorhabditis briggsae]CAP31217.2 Protein CBG12211 [Caenorhabditis briggsae]
MNHLCVLFVFFLTIPISQGVLKCYTGYSIMKGSTIGTETKECGKETDFCYNGTADISSFSKFQKAGCNTVICQVIPISLTFKKKRRFQFHANKCFDQNVSGQQLTFCCCNTGDLCNGGAVTKIYYSQEDMLFWYKEILVVKKKRKWLSPKVDSYLPERKDKSFYYSIGALNKFVSSSEHITSITTTELELSPTDRLSHALVSSDLNVC